MDWQPIETAPKGRSMTEREKIVAWLRRGDWDSEMRSYASEFARMIERGDHKKRPEPTIPASEWMKTPSAR